jgi:hypothetical protein
MRLEELLPEIRKGRKFRQLGAPDCHYQIKGGVIWVGDQWKINIDSEDLLADDWELVPEKRKITAWLKLYDDGSVFGFPTLEKATESMSLAEHHGKARLVETRTIEWEVGE